MTSTPIDLTLTKKEKLLLFTLAFIQFSHIVDFMIMMPLEPQLKRLWDITPHQFGMIVSAYTFSAGATGFLSALYIDRFDRKKSLLFFYVGFCLSTIFCALSPDYQTLLFARLLTGAFGGVLGSLILAIVGDSIPAQKRGTAMGIVMSSFSVASIAGVPFSLYLAHEYSWHAPFIFLGILSSFLIFVINKSIPKMDSHFAADKSFSSPFDVVKSVVTNNNQILALVFMILLIFGQFSVIPFLSASMVANAGLTEAQLPLIYLVGGCITIVTSPLIGRLSDKYGKRKIFSISAIVSILPLLLITNLGVSPLPVILAIVGFFFLCMGGRMVPAMAMITSTVTPKRRGSFMSISSSVQQFGASAASYIAGIVVTRGPTGQLLNYHYVGYMAAVFSVLALIAAQKLKPTEGSF